ncbi:MAG TPA: MBL fold metallo-hydrolase [Kofleriaceae bacterium]|jgi:glyoxylase-like metal-dependent hydrolase (beta-lactamase superfamily II)
MTTRREWLKTMGALSAGALLPPIRPSAHRPIQQQDPLAAFRAQIGAVPIKSQPLTDNLTMLSGPGGNVVVLHGSDGLVMVDTFVAPAWPKLEESLKALGGAPIKTVINTHWHFDHVDNNASLHAAGATVVAHENTKTRMSAPQHIEMLKLDFPASPVEALPQFVFKDGYKVEANGEKIEVKHVPPAHTDTDVILDFDRANVLHAGDVFFNGRYPLIDASTGGKVDGMIDASNRLLNMADPDTKIVPGHGALATKAELAKYRDMLVSAAGRIRKLKTAGRTLDEAVAAKPFTDLDPDWGGGRYKGDDFVKIVYLSL